jgi:cytochrome c biogenesis protein CcmG, thiol:disulfide interchange protein DsbE
MTRWMTGDAVPSPGPAPGAGPEPARGGGRHRRHRLTVAVAAALVLAAGAAVFASVSSSGGNTGSQPLVDRTYTPAPAFALPGLLTPRRTVSLVDFRGKPLVLNFWASWCFPCQTEMPLLESASRAAHGSVQFVGIDTDDSRSAAVSFLRQHHVSYLSLYLADGSGTVGTAYGLIGLPITVFVSADGTMLGRHVGQLQAATLRAALKTAFGS